MKKRTRSAREGFTLIEALIVVVIAGILMTIGLPKLRETMLQAQMVSFGTEIQSVFQRARFEAIRRGLPVVVQMVPDERRIRAYVDVPAFDDDGNRTDVPLELAPEVGLLEPETDHVLFDVRVPNAVVFDAPGAEELIDGMTNISGRAPEDALPSELVLVFSSTGAAQDLGAFRFRGQGSANNFLEARVDFASTGKTTLRKWDCDDSVWRSRDEEVIGRKAWIWYGYFADC